MKHFFSKYTIAIVMLVVVAFQFYMVYNYKLTRWKGGGYGMYAEVNYYLHEIWINTSNAQNPNWKNLDSIGIKDKTILNKIDHTKRLPNYQQLLKLVPEIEKSMNLQIVSMEVWKPLVDVNKGLIQKKLITKWSEP